MIETRTEIRVGFCTGEGFEPAICSVVDLRSLTVYPEPLVLNRSGHQAGRRMVSEYIFIYINYIINIVSFKKSLIYNTYY